MLHRIGEEEGSLWLFLSELFGWREKLNIMLEKVDGGLPFSMVSKDKKKVLGEKCGLKDMGNRFGLERGPIARSISWRPKS